MAWTQILHAVPDSHMLIKWKSFSDEATRQCALRLFSEKGITADRIHLQTAEPSPKHLAAYHSIDIGLDTFPFNGLTTTCEALWMGVPVITLTGDAYASRAGASLLSNIGLSALIADNYDEYVNIAVALATDIKRLQLFREGLRDIMQRSPLMHGKQFTHTLEKQYRKIWKTWCDTR